MTGGIYATEREQKPSKLERLRRMNRLDEKVKDHVILGGVVVGFGLSLYGGISGNETALLDGVTILMGDVYLSIRNLAKRDSAGYDHWDTAPL